MKNNNFKELMKCIGLAIFWTIVIVVITLFISKVKDTNFKDSLFFISLAVIAIGIFVLMSGNPLGLPVYHLGGNSSGFTANIIHMVMTREKEKNNRGHQLSLKSCFNISSIILAGIICFIIDVLI
ncbi:MAG: hypothetical protein RR891_05220 [Clostridium sp.]|uniref:hypothetical protein n=1 Tax=Clostridium sp. TaxID=1506 RepID=UPI00306B79BF